MHTNKRASAIFCGEDFFSRLCEQWKLHTLYVADARSTREGSIEARYPGLKVDLLYSGAVELEQRLWAENEAGRVRADVVWAANPALFLNSKEAGLLMTYESPEAVHVPDWLKDEDHMFIAGRVHNMGIAYNTRFVREDQVPSTWDEFLQWGPRAAMASPLLS